MNNINKDDFWLILHPYIYTHIIGDQFLLLNTLSGEMIRRSDPELSFLVKQLNSKKNGYVLGLSKKGITSKKEDFIQEIRNKYFGDLMRSSISNGKPFQMYPKLNLQNIQKEMVYKILPSKLLKYDIVKEFVKTVSIYINSECSQSCSHCTSSYYQFVDCYKPEKKWELNVNEFQGIVEELNGSSLEKLKILGGNIFCHQGLDWIKDYLDKIPIVKEYYLNYLNFIDQPKRAQILLGEGNRLVITIHFPVAKGSIERMFEKLISGLKGISVRFLIESEKNYEEAIGIIQKYRLKDTQLTPYYNQKNLEFFEDHLFITEDALAKSRVSFTQIFTNQVFNQLSFKTLTITADKKVYGNINHSSLGRVGKDLLMDLVVKEMNSGNSWYHTRSKVIPCKSCLYQNICPPISNYEYYMDKYNVCQIQK